MSMQLTLTCAVPTAVATLLAAVRGRRAIFRVFLILSVALSLSGGGERGAGYAFARPMPDHPAVVEGPFADRLRRALEDGSLDVSQ